jgi:hypothetical protein
MHDCVRAREGVGRWPITASILGGSLFCADSLRACCFQPSPNRVCVRVDDWRGFVAKNTISPPRQRRRAHPLSSIAHVAVDVVIVALWDVLPECSRATSLHGAPPGRLGKRVGASGGGWLSVAPSFCAHAFAQLAHVPSRRPSPPPPARSAHRLRGSDRRPTQGCGAERATKQRRVRHDTTFRAAVHVSALPSIANRAQATEAVTRVAHNHSLSRAHRAVNERARPSERTHTRFYAQRPPRYTCAHTLLSPMRTE